MRTGNILVFRSCGLGDFLLSAPAFHALRKRFPDRRIILLTMQSSNRAVAAHIAAYAGGTGQAPWIGLLQPHLIDDVVAIGNIRSPADLRRTRALLSGLDIGLVVQMIDVGTPWVRRILKLALVALLVGAKRQIGWRRPGVVTRAAVPAVDPKLGHHVHGPLQFLNELDGPNVHTDEDIVFDVRPGRDAECWAQAWLVDKGIAQARLVAIAPGAAHPHKSWPTGQFVALAQAMLELDPAIRIIVAGTIAERAKADEIMAVDPKRIHSAAGDSTIAQSAALFAQCKLVIGNDGGAVHLADAVGSKVVSIVPGLEFPDSIEPWHNRERAIRHPVACAPCYSFTSCPEQHNRCMVDLPLARVMHEVSRALRT